MHSTYSGRPWDTQRGSRGIRASASGKEFGTVGITDDGTTYGYQPFLKQSGADEGDMFILEFDLESETVFLRLGDESLLDSLA